MDDFYEKKEKEIRLLLGRKFQGMEFVLENMGGGTFIANLTDMYFVDGQWRKMYVNRVFHIRNERNSDAINDIAVDDAYEHIKNAMSELLADMLRGNNRY